MQKIYCILAIVLLFAAGCDMGGGATYGDEAATEGVSEVTVTAEGLSVADGVEFKAYAFGPDDFFYQPAAKASGSAVIEGGGGVAELLPSLADGTFYAAGWLDVDPNDGDRPMQGDSFAPPSTIEVSGGSGNLTLGPGDFVEVNVSVTVEHSGVGDGNETRIRVGNPDTTCIANQIYEGFGVMSGGSSEVGIPGVPDGTHSVCALIDVDPATSVTGMPGGADLVAALPAALTVSGTGRVTIPESAFHEVAELDINVPSAPDGALALMTIVDPATQTPLSLGAGVFSGGSASASVPLVFWTLDGNWQAIAILDMDGSGMGISLGDMIGYKGVNISDSTVTPAIEAGDFSTINLIVNIELTGHDGEEVTVEIYQQGSSCEGTPEYRSFLDILSMPITLEEGSAQAPFVDVANGDYEACAEVSVTDGNDLRAVHPFTLEDLAEITITEAEFQEITPQ